MTVIDELQDTLDSFPESNCYWVAYSGGCDSHVLLHALFSLSQLKSSTGKFEIAAVHVNHGLQQNADKWSLHCRKICDDLGVRFKLLKVNAAAKTGQSPEAAAREARYQAISRFLPKNETLLVAHHQDDQAETLLLQLLRGAGPRGLSAMPKMKLMAGNRVLRPFLGLAQQTILEYAKQHQLDWIEDPSNTDTRFDRNRIRHEVLPVMKQRWPYLSKTLARVTQHQAEAAECLRELAEEDWVKVKTTEDFKGLCISKLLQLSQPRQKNLLRYWIEQLNCFNAIDSTHLNRILNEVIPAAIDSQPAVKWQNTQVRRYRDILYVLDAKRINVSVKPQDWNIANTIDLTDQRLVSREIVGKGIKQSLITDGIVNIRYRQGGERCQPSGRANHHTLKKLFQEWAVPPWKRSHIPLIYIKNEIVQIVGYCLCEPFAAGPGEQGISIESEKL